ncbi:hypothetical protein F511_34166 [Dorcoceras hygrometricum]|uniref:Uncharacterized protein n=1 Tax=Dorcoceras hygrometricum TaxID=472368 RepID=A0A2Z7DEI4_9LAMI|nr:hypothetical protein F511_34166 [Dorcoceras hygrometricum]
MLRNNQQLQTFRSRQKHSAVGSSVEEDTQLLTVVLRKNTSCWKMMYSVDEQAVVAKYSAVVGTPLCPAWLPEEPAMANTDPSNPKTGKEYEVKPQNRSSRPTSQLEIRVSLYTTHNQSAGGNHRSVIFRYGHSINHHSPVLFRHDESVGHHFDDSIVPCRRDTSSGRSQCGSIRSYLTQISPGHGNLNLLKSASYRSRQTQQRLPGSSNLNGEKHLLEIAKLLEPATTSPLFLKSIYNSKLVPIKKSKPDEPSASIIAPNGGVNRRKSNQGGFG